MPEKELKLSDLLALLDSIAPRSLAEPWDNVGLMVGDPGQAVSGILLALDPTEEVVKEALSRNCNTILTHHPLLFHPVKSLESKSSLGRILKTILGADLAVLACHTNLDRAKEGVSKALARGLGLEETRPLTAFDQTDPAIGFGRIGRFPAPVSSSLFLKRLFTVLACDGLQLVGHLPETIQTVALCGGSGSDLAIVAHDAGADLYLTGEIKHSTARWAEEAGFCLIDAGHYPTEQIIIPVLGEALKTICREKGFSLPPLFVSTSQSNPMQWVFLHDTAEPGSLSARAKRMPFGSHQPLFVNPSNS